MLKALLRCFPLFPISSTEMEFICPDGNYDLSPDFTNVHFVCVYLPKLVLKAYGF